MQLTISAIEKIGASIFVHNIGLDRFGRVGYQLTSINKSYSSDSTDYLVA